jgi:hypothetical protein
MITGGSRLDTGLCLAYRHPLGSPNPDRRGELGLATRSVEEHDQPSGDQLQDVGAHVILDECQGQFDAGAHPIARQDVAVE